MTSNNSEMRSGSGAFLEAGIVATDDGNLHLEGLRPVTTLTLPVGAVHVGGDLEARWGYLLPGVDWRNLGLTPQFDVNGALAARMWAADTGQHVNGVMALDVAGLQELLTVTGPVTTSSGTVVSADSVDQLLLHDQYVGEGYSSNTPTQVDTARVDQLGSLASAVMQALETKPLGLHALVDALSAATAGRHLMLWSADPSTEAVWRSTGVSGQFDCGFPVRQRHQPRRQQARPVPHRALRAPLGHAREGDGRDPHGVTGQPHPTRAVGLHRRSLPRARHHVRRIRGHRHREPAELRPRPVVGPGGIARGRR